MLVKCLLLLSFVGTVYCGGSAALLLPTSTPPAGCEVDGEIIPIGDNIPGSDPCRPCLCGGDGRPVCAIIDCFPISKSHCGGFEPLKDPSQCCPFCPKCEINGTIYEPGDSLPLGNPCTHECECNRVGRIFCAPVTIRCVPPPRCPRGTKLETMVPVGECCSQYKCVNITCEVKGITYNIGDTIPKKDPCVTCRCSESGEPVCAIIDCFFPNCPPLTKRVITRIPGVCCPNVSCVNVTTCKVKGITYLLGDKIPHEDPCVNCHCSESGPVCGSVGCGLLRCPPSHALVEEKVPGECCPNRTCVPVTCEANGVTYKVGEPIPDDDPCKSCRCASIIANSTRGERICAIIDCFFLNCPPLTKRVITRIPGVCCPNVSCVNVTTCKFKGVTYLLGDKIPHEDPCVNCHCSESGPVCGSVGCGLIQCSLDYALVEEDVPGECCPNRTCVPVTCEANGVTYKVGEILPDDDPCKSCRCARISANLTHGRILCSITACASKKCPPGTKRVITRIPGACCYNVSCVNVSTCKVNEITYNVGDKIPHEDPCVDCHCSESGPVCGSVGCPPLRCPPNHALVEEKVPGECCPNRTCVPVTCEVDGITYKVGELIPDDDPCKSCRCASIIIANSTRGERICASIACVPTVCPPGTKRVITQIPGVCCPNVSCIDINVTTCEVDEITYNVGDKIPHEDPCVNCRCFESGPVCGSVGCPTRPCPPFTELVQTPIPGECCPKQECVPSALLLVQGSFVNRTRSHFALCGSCLSSACNVTSCKACYYSEGAPRSLPGGCEKYTCATKMDNITKLQKCMLKFGKCIRTRDKRLYGKPTGGVIRPRNFKCYAFPCEP